MKTIKKSIAMALIGLTMAGTMAAMPAVKVGNVTVGTETVSAATYGSTRTVRHHWYQQFGNWGGKSWQRSVYLNYVYRNGVYQYHYVTYGSWVRLMG